MKKGSIVFVGLLILLAFFFVGCTPLADDTLSRTAGEAAIKKAADDAFKANSAKAPTLSKLVTVPTFTAKASGLTQTITAEFDVPNDAALDGVLVYITGTYTSTSAQGLNVVTGKLAAITTPTLAKKITIDIPVPSGTTLTDASNPHMYSKIDYTITFDIYNPHIDTTKGSRTVSTSVSGVVNLVQEDSDEFIAIDDIDVTADNVLEFALYDSDDELIEEEILKATDLIIFIEGTSPDATATATIEEFEFDDGVYTITFKPATDASGDILVIVNKANVDPQVMTVSIED